MVNSMELETRVRALIQEAVQIPQHGLILVSLASQTLVEIITEDGTRTGRAAWLELNQFTLTPEQQSERAHVRPLSVSEGLAVSALEAICRLSDLEGMFPDAPYVVEALCDFVGKLLLDKDANRKGGS